MGGLHLRGHLDLDQADLRQLTIEAYAIRLLDALREGTTPAIRQHDGTDLLD